MAADIAAVAAAAAVQVSHAASQQLQTSSGTDHSAQPAPDLVQSPGAMFGGCASPTVRASADTLADCALTGVGTRQQTLCACVDWNKHTWEMSCITWSAWSFILQAADLSHDTGLTATSGEVVWWAK